MLLLPYEDAIISLQPGRRHSPDHAGDLILDFENCEVSISIVYKPLNTVLLQQPEQIKINSILY